MFFNHLAKSYAAFLSGDDELFGALEDELAANFGAWGMHVWASVGAREWVCGCMDVCTCGRACEVAGVYHGCMQRPVARLLRRSWPT